VSESTAAVDPQLGAYPSPFTELNRDAMRADAAAVLSWLQSSVTWTLLDQTVTPLLGRSPLQIASALFSAVIDLSDVELDTLAWLVVGTVGRYVEPEHQGIIPLDDPERAALAALRAALAGAFGL
jgi:hypothetical protein